MGKWATNSPNRKHSVDRTDELEYDMSQTASSQAADKPADSTQLEFSAIGKTRVRAETSLFGRIARIASAVRVT